VKQAGVVVEPAPIAEYERRTILRQLGLLSMSGLGPESAPPVRIGLIDSPVCTDHPVFSSARIEQYPHIASLRDADTRHGTFIASILVGSGAGVLGIAPRGTLVSLPVQDLQFQRQALPAREVSLRIAGAIDDALDRGVDLIQMSMDFLPEADPAFEPVCRALGRAASRGVCTVVAAGNQPRLGSSAVLAQLGVLPVAMADRHARFHANSPMGIAIGRGLSCRGENLPGALPPTGITRASGSSFAAAVACGAVALLKGIKPRLSSLQIVHARGDRRSTSLVPPMLNAQRWLAALSHIH
jgi:subtilisin family serine protease